MSNAVYGLPTENVAPDLTWAGIAVDPTYDIADLVNGDPSEVVLFTAATGTLTATGAATRIDLLIIANQGLDAGATVTLSNDSGLTPVVATSVAYENRHRNALYFDLTGSSIAARTSGAWSLAIAGNTVPIALGNIAAYSLKRSLTRNIKWGLLTPERHRVTVISSTLEAQTVYNPQLWHRSVKGSIQTTDAGMADLQALARAAEGLFAGFLFVLDPAKPDDAIFARFQSEEFVPRWDFLDNTEVADFAIEEYPKGPRL